MWSRFSVSSWFCVFQALLGLTVASRSLYTVVFGLFFNEGSARGRLCYQKGIVYVPAVKSECYWWLLVVI
ncbi:hypothetical protein AALP_AA3G241500 [Arabis alpina]|uniref:Uncharacterized protein n=1 Tax=Arabis alpina TaxID=50452 RepID=A0A087HBB0_ARAAL|nr:hypothetical protein AALP_AA3G241500 [Arabis alpina]